MILCFSGTGNSRYVAQLLSERLGDEVVMLDRELYDSPILHTGDRLIWVYPIYSWGTPPVVRSVMTRLKTDRDDTHHFMVATCGDDIGDAASMWRRDMARRHWNAVGAYSVIMPNTYTLMKGFDVDSPEVAARKVADATARVDTIARAITAGVRTDDCTRGKWAWFKTAIIYRWFVAHDMSPKPFHATDSCTGCGTCARTCPLDNITMRDGMPHWGDTCALCLGCYHSCPCHAIAYGKATRDKGQKKIL